MARIMIVEDDQALRNQIKEMLTDYDYTILAIEEFHNIEEQFTSFAPDLVLLDINLPYHDGNYICRKLRKSSKIPIIITSARNSEMDQIFSMEVGADDYVVKPFSISVLLAKINALLRRTYGEYIQGEQSGTTQVEGIVLQDKDFTLFYQGRSVELSKNEYRLMKAFMQRPNEIITRETLLELLWDTQDFVDDNTLTVNITRLKGQLQTLELWDVIKTKRGVGYYMDTEKMEEDK